VPIFKRGRHTAVSNYRPISILNNFSKVFLFIIQYHVLHYVELNPNQYGFTKSKSALGNFVTLLDFMSPVVHGQRQADAVYFHPSNASDLVPHNMLLHKLSIFGLLDGYVSWFHNYLTNRQSRARLSGTLPLLFRVISGVPQGSVLRFFISTNSLMPYVPPLTIENF
jgi:hypothetical protein